MKTYVFSTPYMCSGVLIKGENLKDVKRKIRNYLCVKRLPNNTTIEKYIEIYS